MKAEFLSCAKLRRGSWRSSLSLRHMEHCPMDIVAEELAFLGGVNLLVVGTEECAFHSNKIPFSDAVNESFVLTDDEIVLQDLSSLEEVVRMLEGRDEPTVVLRTCIPCLMNLDISSLSAAENVLFLDASASAFLSSEDILEELYDLLFRHRVEIGSGDDTCPVLPLLFCEAGREKVFLPSRVWILRQRKYRKLLSGLAKKNPGVRFFDDTHLHRIEDYLEAKDILGIDSEEGEKMMEMAERLRNRSLPPVFSAHAADLALALGALGVSLSKIVLPRLDERTYRVLKTLGEDCLVSFERELPEGTLDLSPCDILLESGRSFDVLKTMMEELVHAVS